MKKSVIFAAVLVLSFTARTPGADSGPSRLAPEYIDPVRGYSLRPPAGTTRSRATSANRLVSWTMRKTSRSPILWRLSIYWRTEKTYKPGSDLLTYGRGLAKRLEKAEGFQAAGPRVIDLPAGKGINLRGSTTGKVKFWQRRVWVYLRASEFLEVRISGPVADKNKLDTIATDVLKTLKIVDPKEALAQRKKALARGAELLKALTDRKLTGALDTSDQWYLYYRDDKAIGFMCQKEATAKSRGKSGCRIKSWIVMNLGGQTVKLRRDMFTSTDRSGETWTEAMTVESPQRNISMKEKGTKSDARIDCELTSGARKVTQKPATAPQDNYLPRAMAWLLRRMVDLDTPASYAFATYSGQSGRFNMRTFTIIGPKTIEIAGRKVTAIRVTDQLTAEVQAADMWVDKDGKLLIMKTADGLVMELASQKSVARRFPEAGKTIKTMGQ
ncbi:MAG: hypothetical protein GY794_15070 [bacterium]|nr:hypothetical protein [bacterium]